ATGGPDRRSRAGARARARGAGGARVHVGGRARRLCPGERQRERRGEEDQGAGAHRARRAADERHRPELLPVVGHVPVARPSAAVKLSRAPMLKRAIPVIHVADAAAAEAFYCGQLGFTRVAAWRSDEKLANPAYLTIERDGVQLHVTSFTDGTVGSWTSNVYIFSDNVDDLFAEFRRRGVEAVSSPVDQSWGTREFGVRDADRNVISFGQRRPRS